MAKVDSENNGIVRWKTLIPIILTIILIGGVAVGYALNSTKEYIDANKEYLHPDAVRFREIEPLSRDISELKADVREVRKMLTRFIMGKK